MVTRITTKKLKEELNKFEADPFDINSFKFRKPTEIILKLLNIYNEEKFNFLLPSKKEVISLRNKILKEEI